MRKVGFLSAPFLTLVIAASADAQLPGLGRLKGKDGDKTSKEREAQVQKADKTARIYERLKEFSLDLYEKDPDFREEVEKHFDNIQKEHSLYAFDKNIAPPARPTVVHDGDRLRLQTGLYDNKLVQDYINRVGQRLVPEDSERLFAFRLVAHPIPFAETLSTGTIYISTGLISLLDNEAQLAYVLAHEMAHVYLDDWKMKSMLELGEEEYNKKQERKRRWFALAAAAGSGAVAGAASGSGQTALSAGILGGAAGYAIAHVVMRGINLDWDKVQEDKADQMAFKVALNRNYDVQEVPKLYLALQGATRRDNRVGLGFLGSRKRVTERIANVNDLIGGPFKGEIAQKLKEAKLVGSNPDFAMVMSELKRDNGILAFYHDMFQLAKSNLEYAVQIRSNDPAAHYYHGKVLKLVGRTPAEQQAAEASFLRATQFDARNRYYGAHFYRALALINLKDSTQNPEIVKSLQAYLNAHLGYASEEAMLANYLPANLDDLYDYMAQAGEVKWTPVLPEGARAAIASAPAAGEVVLRPVSSEAIVSPSVRTPNLVGGSPGTGADSGPGGISPKVPGAIRGAAAGAAVGGTVGGGRGAVSGGAAGAVGGAVTSPEPRNQPKKK